MSGVLAVSLSLSACTTATRLDPLPQGPYAPGTQVDRSFDLAYAADGLAAGHRLMEAGQYELALKSYYRAAAAQGMTNDIRSALGSANLRLGRLNQAEVLLREAVEVDDSFVPAWNNLGVVLMEKGEIGEASRVFRTAFALDGANTPEIRENLRLALAKLDNSAYTPVDNYRFDLVRRGSGDYRLLSTP